MRDGGRTGDNARSVGLVRLGQSKSGGAGRREWVRKQVQGI